MTQDKVDFIYDYLHENYEYRDGELIKLKSGQGKKKGGSIGCFHHSHKHGPRFVVNLSINKKLIVIDLRKAIFIYINKSCPNYVTNIDGNITNNRSENLIGSNRPFCDPNKPQKNSSSNVRGVCLSRGKWVSNLCLNGSNIFLGHYPTKEKAGAAYQKAKELTINFNGDVKEFKKILKEHGYGFTSKLPKGVEKNRLRFSARYYHQGKRMYAGTYDAPEEAHAAYLKAKEECKNS